MREMTFHPMTSQDVAERVRCPLCRERAGDSCNFLEDKRPWFPRHDAPLYHPERLDLAAITFPGIDARKIRLRELQHLGTTDLMTIFLRVHRYRKRRNRYNTVDIPASRDGLIAALLPNGPESPAPGLTALL